MTKRAFDALVVLLVAPAAVVICLVVALLVRLRLGRPVMFWQVRAGLRGRPFRLLKFRTMTDAHDDDGRLLPDVERLTDVGNFLRSTSLDELPELWNVLRGEMSLVGPRPLLLEYLPLYSAEQARRHAVRPGITGWAQINGRNSISWEERFRFDVWYVNNRSLWLDVKILVLSALTVLRRDHISEAGHATMRKYSGTEG